MWPPANETIFPADEAVVKQKANYQRFLTAREIRVRKMIEALTVVLGLLGAGLFLAHAVDAYLTS
jgi:hypothetical protein